MRATAPHTAPGGAALYRTGDALATEAGCRRRDQMRSGWRGVCCLLPLYQSTHYIPQTLKSDPVLRIAERITFSIEVTFLQGLSLVYVTYHSCSYPALALIISIFASSLSIGNYIHDYFTFPKINNIEILVIFNSR